MSSPSQTLSIFTVSQLTQSIKLQLEQAFPKIHLQGEISNFRRQSSGHLYFSLKDSHSQIGAVMFNKEAASLTIEPKDGDQVLIEGELNVYPPSGKYQLIIHSMRLVGLGELLLKLEALKREIHKRGWFSREHKKPLPKLPKKIGVVTSPTGAVIRDILHVLTRRFAGLHIILSPVKVQGEGASYEIARAIDELNRYELVDVIIVGRGGGSMEDLWPFNEEIVAQAIYNSKIPIIAAVGHETDHCIAEYVADMRAPTPSAAAEMVIGEKVHLLAAVEQLRRRLNQSIIFSLRKQKESFLSLRREPFFSSPYSWLAPRLQNFDLLCDNLNKGIKLRFAHLHLILDGRKRQLAACSPRRRMQLQREKIDSLKKNFIGSFRQLFNRLSTRFSRQKIERHLVNRWIERCSRHRDKLSAIAAALEAANPKLLLQKGYCILYDTEEKTTVTSIHQLSAGKAINLVLADGKAEAIITQLVPNESKK